MNATLRRAVFGFAVAALAACGGDNPQEPVVPAGSRVSLAGGNLQSVPVAAVASNALSVTVEDSNHAPIANVPVTWTVLSGGGTVSPGTSNTDANGVATTTFTAGTTAGLKVVHAEVFGATGSPVSFNLTALPGAAKRLVKNSGDQQLGNAGQFPLPLAVSVVDTFGNGVEGVSVAWSASGVGTVSPANSVTLVSGQASTLFTGSSVGAATVTGSVAGLQGSPVTFTATVVATITLVKTLVVPSNYGLHDTFVRGGLAFLNEWNSGLHIYDVGDGRAGGSPANPVEIGTGIVTSSNGVSGGPQVHNSWWYWAPNGDKKYVFIGQEGPATGGIGNGSSGDIHVVDVSNMASPVEVAFFHLAGAGTHNFWVDEQREILYAAYYNGGIVALNIAGALSGDLSTQGRTIGNVKPGGASNTYVWGVQLYNGSLYATDMLSGFWQLNPNTLATIGGGNNVPERYGSDQWLANGYAYSGTWGVRGAAPGTQGNAVKVWRLGTTGAPTLVDSIVRPNIGTVSDLEVSADNKMLMFSAERGSGAGVYIYSLVQNPAHPTFIGYFPVPSTSGGGVHTATFADIGAKRYVFCARDPDVGSSPALLILDVTALIP